MPHFTEDWFSHHAPHWERLFFGTLGWDAAAARRVVEIGAFEGRATLWFLDHLLPDPGSRLFVLDTFAGGAEHAAHQTDGLWERFSANLAEHPGRAKARILRGPSAEGLLTLLAEGEAADLVYVDGSHEAPDVLEDLVLGFRLLCPGGVMLCDDYLWTREETPRADILGAPKLAIDAFTNIFRRRIDLLEWGHSWQFAFRKRAEERHARPR